MVGFSHVVYVMGDRGEGEKKEGNRNRRRGGGRRGGWGYSERAREKDRESGVVRRIAET